MALRGTLKDFALPDIFQLIGMQRKTGMLTLESDRETVTVLFEKGMVVHADSSVRRLDDLLGNVLVRQGKLKKESLDEALARQKISMQRLGYILTNQGYIEAKDLKEALSEQVQQTVFRIFRWKSGSYHFDPSSTVDYDRANVTPVSTDHILMEGIRRVDEWPIIEKRIPSLSVVFRPLVPQNQITVAEEGGSDESGGLTSAFENLEGTRPPTGSGASDRIVLSPTESKIYSLVNGKRSVAAIVDMTGLSDFDVCRTLFDFIDRRLIAQAKQSEVSRAPKQVKPADIAEPLEGVRRPSALGIVAPPLLLLLVLGAIGSLMPWAFRVPLLANTFATAVVHLEQALDLSRLERIDHAVRLFYLTHGDYPTSLDDLANATPAILSVEQLRDSQGRPIGYRRSADSILLEAMGGPRMERFLEPVPVSTEAVDSPVP